MRVMSYVIGISVLLLVARDAPAGDEPNSPAAPPVPSAPEVVVRGQTTLAGAVQACLTRASAGGFRGTAALVLDVTETTKLSALDLAHAIEQVWPRDAARYAWQVAALGGPLSSPTVDDSAFEAAVTAACAQGGSGGPDTLGRLRLSLRDAKVALVIYVAHEQFEDAVDLEGFIGEMRAGGRCLCVIGSEAGFERAWVDLSNPTLKRRAALGEASLPIGGLSPFEPDDPTAPWRGGDTAYPQVVLPMDWDDGPWEAESMASVKAAYQALEPPPASADDATFYRWASFRVVPPDPSSDPEKFRAWRTALGPPPERSAGTPLLLAWLTKLRASAPRAGGSGTADGLASALHPRRPCPSGFGPYGLMRAAGATRGCYVLWQWDGFRSGEPVGHRYDPKRCDELAPDLRSRAEILADVSRRPLARALMRAWTLLATSRPALCMKAPPLWADLPSTFEYISGTLFIARFRKPSDRDREVARGTTAARRLDRVRSLLQEDAASVQAPLDAVDRRLEADVELLLLALASTRFEVQVFTEAARSVPITAWGPDGNTPVSLDSTEYLPTQTSWSLPPRDAEAGAALAKLRKDFLARFQGTPYGAIVEANSVRVHRWDPR